MPEEQMSYSHATAICLQLFGVKND
jgi:hypothetical protein